MNACKKALSVKEACATLGVSKPTLYRLMKTEGFPVFRLGGRTLISAAGLDAWIAARVREGAEI